MFADSLRFRIQLWHGFLLAAVLTGFAWAAYRHQADADIRRVDVELRQRVRVLMNTMTAPRQASGPPIPGAPREFKLSSAREAMFDGSDGTTFYYAVWRRDGSEWACSAQAPLPIERPFPEVSDEMLQGERTRGNLREAYTFTPPGECLLVGRSFEPEKAALHDYARWLAAIATSVLAFALAIGWWITSRAIRPIATITETARRIAKGELHERIPVRSVSSELGHLSTVLNDTFTQLESSFARQARFTADAAHELRTPVAIILSQAQRVLTRERDSETYQRTLEACVSAARRLNQLTESLLQLATHDGNAITMKRATCDLAAITRETVTTVQPLADERRVSLDLELVPASFVGDDLRISQVILNLLINALDHTPEAGHITLCTRAEAGYAVFSITDTGCGIPSEHLAHIFDRFYRADSSRSRSTGGAGLGLSICKAIADEHGGTLDVTSIEGQGCVFTLQLPA